MDKYTHAKSQLQEEKSRNIDMNRKDENRKDENRKDENRKDENRKDDNLNRIWTIPNILSMFRLALIPVIVWLYCFEMEYQWAAVILILSGLTDLVDGFIARRFNMISNLGKALDPVADKMTQFVVLICLVTKFPKMLVPVCLLPVKELTTGILSFLVIRRTGKVDGADWHGKVATALLDATMVLHVLWAEITELFSTVTIVICTAMILVSFVLYTLRHLRILAAARTQS